MVNPRNGEPPELDFTPEALERVKEKITCFIRLLRSRAIEIAIQARLDNVSRRHVDEAYELLTNPHVDKAYELLAKTERKSTRSKQFLQLVGPLLSGVGLRGFIAELFAGNKIPFAVFTVLMVAGIALVAWSFLKE